MSSQSRSRITINSREMICSRVSTLDYRTHRVSGKTRFKKEEKLEKLKKNSKREKERY